METNLVKKGLQSIYGGLQLLSENKTESLSSLAEISIILSHSIIVDRYQLDDKINELLSSFHFLLKDITQESVKEITDYINSKDLEQNTTASNIDYKHKYEQTLEKVNILQEELLSLNVLTKN